MTKSARSARLAVRLLAIVATLYYGAAAVSYGTDRRFGEDHVGPTMAMLAGVCARGQPLYTDLDSPNRYSLLYGPSSFVLSGALTRLLGDPLLSSKLVGMAAGLLSLALFIVVARRAVPGGGGRSVLVYVVLCLSFQNYTFWNRPDSLMLLGATLVLASVTVIAPWGQLVLRALGFALLVNGKAHGFLYVLPLVPLFGARWSAAAAQALVLTALSAGLPFVLFPEVSGVNYLGWLRAASGHPLSLPFLFKTLWFALFMVAPAAALAWLPTRLVPRPARRWLAVACLSGAAMVAMHLVAAKQGAGRHHLIPFIPAVALGVGFLDLGQASSRRASSWLKGCSVAWLTGLVVLAAEKQVHFIRATLAVRDQEVASDVALTRARLAGKRVAFGYGSDRTYELSLFRPLFWDLMPDYFLDVPALMDMSLARMSLPNGTYEKLASGFYDAFVLPRDEAPFSLRSTYDRSEIFDERFRRTFRAHYKLAYETRLFGVWLRDDGGA